MLRQLVVVEPYNPTWAAKLEVCESRRISELRLSLAVAFESGDVASARRLYDEAHSQGWHRPVPDRVKSEAEQILHGLEEMSNRRPSGRREIGTDGQLSQKAVRRFTRLANDPQRWTMAKCAVTAAALSLSLGIVAIAIVRHSGVSNTPGLHTPKLHPVVSQSGAVAPVLPALDAPSVKEGDDIQTVPGRISGSETDETGPGLDGHSSPLRGAQVASLHEDSDIEVSDHIREIPAVAHPETVSLQSTEQPAAQASLEEISAILERNIGESLSLHTSQLETLRHHFASNPKLADELSATLAERPLWEAEVAMAELGQEFLSGRSTESLLQRLDEMSVQTSSARALAAFLEAKQRRVDLLRSLIAAFEDGKQDGSLGATRRLQRQLEHVSKRTNVWDDCFLEVLDGLAGKMVGSTESQVPGVGDRASVLRLYRLALGTARQGSFVLHGALQDVASRLDQKVEATSEAWLAFSRELRSLHNEAEVEADRRRADLKRQIRGLQWVGAVGLPDGTGMPVLFESRDIASGELYVLEVGQNHEPLRRVVGRVSGGHFAIDFESDALKLGRPLFLLPK